MKHITRQQFIFVINSIFAVLLVLAYVLKYLPPKLFALLSVLSLSVPLLILINIIFCVYWLLKLKRLFLLSFFILILGYLLFGSLYRFSNDNDLNTTSSSKVSILNYNVRLFNLYNWINLPDAKQKIETFISDKQPDVINFQEYHFKGSVNLEAYPYKYEKIKGEKIKYGQVTFSKYPIINSGSVEFPSSSNNAIFVDIVKHLDTIRIYNLHLQSLKINPEIESLKQEASTKLFKRVAESFKKQHYQTDMFMAHRNKSPYPTIVTGDFNNTQFSYVYNTIKGDMTDAFDSAGDGFGSTYNFKFFPIRIDFILVDDSFNVLNFDTFRLPFSDHFPIMTTVSLNK